VNALPTAAVALGDEIERFGSYFGYAAIIGLGVLSLLYFAQAREVRRLREWAGRAPERDAEVAQRVQSDAQRRVVAQPVPSPGPQTPAAQSAEAARKVAAAAVMEKFQPPGSAPAAPAIGPPGSLTRATPAVGAPAPAATPDADAPPAAPGAPSPSPSPAPSPAARAAGAAGVAPANADKAQASAPDAPAPPAPRPPLPLPPGMSAATADAVAAARQAATPSRSPAFSNGTGGQETHESDAARPAPLPDVPPTASTGSRRPRAPLPDAHDDAGISRGRKAVIAAAAAATVLVLGVVLVLVLTSGGIDKPPAGNQIGDATPPAAVSPPAAGSGLTKTERAATSVAVLNGTTQTGLASAVAQTIEKQGFTILATKTNADQQIATTTVSYSLGNERAARAVAQIMRVPASAIGPIDANTSVAASPGAKIVVIVGTDKSGAG
jgi:LytR cell envelope-related transcriptional attenuator